MNASTIDPITLEIMRHRWRSIADEGCASMVRASYSPNIKDRFDCSTAVALPDGQVLAQSEIGTPLHLGIMPAVLRTVLAACPVETLAPGDAVITNLPYPEGPGHLPDLSMVSAVHHEGRAIALVATTAHHVDMGGYAPGSMPFGVTEIYQEGLQIPPVRIMRGGTLDESLFALIHQNVRTQSEMFGDLMAQYAAACTAERRVSDLLAQEDPQTVLDSMPAILDHAERCMRDAIAQLADGRYCYEDHLDDDGVSEDPVRIAAAVTIDGNGLHVDFTGTSDQVLGPLNARLPAAQACVYYVAKAIFDPDLPVCAGAYRPITVTAPDGSLLQARFPAAIGNANILTDQRVVDVLLGALYAVAPNQVCAACSGEMNLINVGGIDPRSGAYYNYVETYGGGQGAFHDADGQDGIHTHLTNTRNTSVEVIERTYPLKVHRYGLIPDSAGVGRHRGGCGIVREIECLGPRTQVTVGADRRKFTPWGVEGGQAARGAHCRVTSRDGSSRELPTKFFTALQEGDRLHIETPGGGGWGPPEDRAAEAVQQDVIAGLLSEAQGREAYGANCGQ